MIDGYINWLQNALGNDYIVTNEEKTDYKTDKNVVILSEYSGTNFRKAISFTYQATVLTNNVEKTMKELQEFTWMHNDERISTPEFPYIRNLMQQPVNVSNFQEYNNQYIGTIIIAINLIASVSINDIKSITIDGELIDPTQSNLTYQTIQDTNRINGNELSTTDINESSLILQIVFPMDYSNLFVKSCKIMFGMLPKNEAFNVAIKLINNMEFTSEFKLASKAIACDRAALTIDSITLVR